MKRNRRHCGDFEKRIEIPFFTRCRSFIQQARVVRMNCTQSTISQSNERATADGGKKMIDIGCFSRSAVLTQTKLDVQCRCYVQTAISSGVKKILFDGNVEKPRHLAFYPQFTEIGMRRFKNNFGSVEKTCILNHLRVYRLDGVSNTRYSVFC